METNTQPTLKKEVNTLVNRLTNHQRNKWARAGYPGLNPANPEKIKPFVPGEPYIVDENGNVV